MGFRGLGAGWHMDSQWKGSEPPDNFRLGRGVSFLSSVRASDSEIRGENARAWGPVVLFAQTPFRRCPKPFGAGRVVVTVMVTCHLMP